MLGRGGGGTRERGSPVRRIADGSRRSCHRRRRCRRRYCRCYRCRRRRRLRRRENNECMRGTGGEMGVVSTTRGNVSRTRVRSPPLAFLSASCTCSTTILQRSPIPTMDRSPPPARSPCIPFFFLLYIPPPPPPFPEGKRL